MIVSLCIDSVLNTWLFLDIFNAYNEGHFVFKYFIEMIFITGCL